jgi:hypothetical protein
MDLVEEDPAGVPATRKHLDLVGDARPGGVDEVEERPPDAGRGLLDAEDLLDSACTPAPRFHGRVVRHQGHQPAVDPAETSDHSVRRKLFGESVGEKAVFDERARVEQKVEALSRGQLVLLAQLGQVSRPALARLLAQLFGARARHYLPLKSGSRFSKNALMPSRESSVCETSRNWPCR